MYKYKLGLVMGGLMEDPEFHIENVKNVTAENIKEAKMKWAFITGTDKLPDWSVGNQTYWGWSVKVIESDDQSLKDNDYFRSKVIYENQFIETIVKPNHVYRHFKGKNYFVYGISHPMDNIDISIADSIIASKHTESSISMDVYMRLFTKISDNDLFLFCHSKDVIPEDLVIYVEVDKNYKTIGNVIWARPLEIFCDAVDTLKYPEFHQRMRFELLGSSSIFEFDDDSDKMILEKVENPNTLIPLIDKLPILSNFSFETVLFNKLEDGRKLLKFYDIGHILCFGTFKVLINNIWIEVNFNYMKISDDELLSTDKNLISPHYTRETYKTDKELTEVISDVVNDGETLCTISFKLHNKNYYKSFISNDFCESLDDIFTYDVIIFELKKQCELLIKMGN